MTRMTEVQVTYRDHDEDHDTIVSRMKSNGWQVEQSATDADPRTILTHPQMPGNIRTIEKEK